MKWLRFVFVGVAIWFQAACLITGARAQDSDLECDSFVKNADGSWTVIRKAYIPGPNIRVEEGAVFRPGGTFLGDDLAAKLDRACPNVPVSTPAAVQTAKVPLSTHADQNGNIDVRQLTCAHLDDASGEETDLLLAWYGGWYNALAKKRGFNLMRLRSVINNVVDYCKANPGKNLLQVVDLMLR
jgi:HdeA/HdeB family